MTEFETQNTVEVVIDDRSLTEAKADVEEALSSVPMDVQASVSGGDGGGSPGGGVADEWREQHSLSRERNRLLEQLVDAQEEGNFDRAARAGGGLLGRGAAILGAGALLGVGALSSVLSNFSWPSLPEFSWPELPDLKPPGPPGWVPIDVVEPDPIEVVEPDPVELIMPDSDAAEEPTSTPTTEPQPATDPEPAGTPSTETAVTSDPAPAEEFGRELGGDPAGRDAATAPTTAETAEASPDDSEGDSGAVKTIGALSGLTAGGAAAYLLRNGGSTAARGAASAGAGAFPTPGMVGATDQEEFNQRRRSFNKQTPDWLQLPEIEGENKYSGSVFTAEGRQAQVEGIRELVSAIKDFREDIRSTQEDTSSTRSTNVNVESNVTVDGATRREVERAAESAKQEALRDFERKIRSRRP